MSTTTDGWRDMRDMLRSGMEALSLYAKGCRFCGRIEERHVPLQSGGSMVVYYPGVECCPDALRQQVKWRIEEIDAVRKRMADREKAVAELREHVDLAPTRSAAEAAAKRADFAEKSLQRELNEVFTAELRRLSGDLARLKKKLAALEGAQQAS